MIGRHAPLPLSLNLNSRDKAMSKITQLLLLDKNQIDTLTVPLEILAAVREAFVLHSQGLGRLFPVVRERLTSGGVFGIKSGDVGSEGLLGFKAAGFWPGNLALASASHQATILLIDPQTGRPLCLLDGNAITAIRTGAAGALGLQQLARADSTRLCVFGTGIQARIHTQFALSVMPQLSTFRYVAHHGSDDPNFEAAISDIAARQNCSVSSATDPDSAVSDSDIVITTTPGRGPLFSIDAVRPGTHLTCVGTDTAGKRELPEGMLRRARVIVDDAAQARIIGELQWASALPCIELGNLITGKRSFRRHPEDITLFDMTGIALQDLTVARLLMHKAQSAQFGTLIDWPW